MNHSVVPNSFGKSEFGWLTATFVTCTFALAFSLEAIIKALTKLNTNLRGNKRAAGGIWVRLKNPQVWRGDVLVGRRKGSKRQPDVESQDEGSEKGYTSGMNGSANGLRKKVRFVDELGD